MIVDLSDKVVIVTGAASGIGAAIAQCAADSDVGALVLTDRDPDGCARVRVNGINLGWVATEGEHHMQSVTLGHGECWLEDAESQMPLGRLVSADEAARFAVYLLSDVSVALTGTVTDLEQRVSGAIL